MAPVKDLTPARFLVAAWQRGPEEVHREARQAHLLSGGVLRRQGPGRDSERGLRREQEGGLRRERQRRVRFRVSFRASPLFVELLLVSLQEVTRVLI